jgi:hypothetical protein
MRNHTIAVLRQKQHLDVPRVGTEWPAVTKHDGLTVAPVLVIDLRAVFGFDCAHLSLLEFRNSDFFLYTISRSLIRRLSQSQNVEDVFPDFVGWYQAQLYLYLFR